MQVPLTRDALNDVKSVVTRHIDDGGVIDNAISLKGAFYFRKINYKSSRISLPAHAVHPKRSARDDVDGAPTIRLRLHAAAVQGLRLSHAQGRLIY